MHALTSVKMSFFIVILLCLGLFINDSLGKTRRIIGGTITDIKNFPFMVSFRMPTSNEHFCGGTIITKQHILTAAHCLYSRQKYYMVIKIYTGTSSSWNTTGPYHEIKFAKLHPYYIPAAPKNGNFFDIAIVETRKYIKFNEYQQPAILETENIQTFKMASLIGWGLTEYPSTFYEENLRQLSTVIIDNNQCKSRIEVPIIDEHLCAVAKVGAGGCIGDSGGPLISNDKIVGIYSFSLPCALGFPDIFTRIYPFLEFINSTINK